ncbi:MAG: ATP-binding protein [Treponema sp.]|jgi:anti-sigma regulatory factor (Ser/Thr protein kinase)|nr:ATP-binding protein [Treponema sp.]
MNELSNELSIEAKPENMDTVLDFINEHLGDCPSKVRNQIGIAVDEIFSNIARYAYHPDVGGAVVRITVDNNITIEFEDNGIAYNPLSADDPDVSLSAEEREIGGLGVFMVKKIMDSVEYRREDNKNILTIKKKVDVFDSKEQGEVARAPGASGEQGTKSQYINKVE